jgi:uncharacterized protein (TIGR03437 family)
VNAVVPYAVAGRRSTRVQLDIGGLLTEPVDAPVRDAAPGLFTLGATGRGQGAIVNADGTLNAPLRPAARGSLVSLYGTGGGAMIPPAADGQFAPMPPANLAQRVQVRIGGVNAPVLYAGAAPGLVNGVIQVNVQVPPNVPIGPAVQVTLMVGDVTGPAAATIAVR